MRESRSALIAYYYFDFRDRAKRKVEGLLASLLWQLADNSDPCFNIVSETCHNDPSQPSNDTLAECLKTVLNLPGQVPVYIIVDALDECRNDIGSPSDRDRTLSFVQDLVESNLPNLFICVISRPEHDIRTILDPLTSSSSSRRISLHEEVGQREDIDSYIRFFVHNQYEMRRWRNRDKELVINTLSERAAGM
jgi:hypothetical protein